MKILVLDANPNTKSVSHSKWAADYYLEKLKTDNEVTIWPLYKMDIPVIDEDVFSAWYKFQNDEQLSDSEKLKIEKRSELLDEFLTFDHYVIVSPLWNFGIPPQLKALIDVVAVAGKTFKYTENGPEGLLAGSFTHIQASGGVYSEMPEIEFGNRFIAHIFNFMGLHEKKPLLIEGTNMGSFERETFLPELEAWIAASL